MGAPTTAVEVATFPVCTFHQDNLTAAAIMGGVLVVMHCRSRVHEHRPSHPYDAGPEHAGFSPTKREWDEKGRRAGWVVGGVVFQMFLVGPTSVSRKFCRSSAAFRSSMSIENPCTRASRSSCGGVHAGRQAGRGQGAAGSALLIFLVFVESSGGWVKIKPDITALPHTKRVVCSLNPTLLLQQEAL